MVIIQSGDVLGVKGVRGDGLGNLAKNCTHPTRNIARLCLKIFAFLNISLLSE